MTKQLIVKDFAQLPALLATAGRHDLLPEPLPMTVEPAPGAQNDIVPPLEGAAAGAAGSGGEAGNGPAAGSELARLVADMEAVAAGLARLYNEDERNRTAALRALERYDAVVAAQTEAVQVCARAQTIREQSLQLAQRACGASVREAAERYAATAAGAEQAAEQAASELALQVQMIGSNPDVEWALAERQRVEEEQRIEAEAIAREQRRQEALRTARVAMESGWLDEAVEALRSALTEHPGDPELAALVNEVRRREVDRRAAAATRALWAARKELRRQPAAAIEQLVGLNLSGVDVELRSQVFGAWSRACGRLCRERGERGALLYAPHRAKGVVLTREADGPYVVVSAFDMGPGWRIGQPVQSSIVGRARALLA